MKLGLGAAEKGSIMTPDAPGAVGPEQKGASGSAAPAGFVRATQTTAIPLPQLVAYSLEESGLIKFTDMPAEFPVVGDHVQQFVRHMDQDEFVELFPHFRGKTLSRGGGVERALETYYLAKKQKEHENSLRAVSMPGRSGIGGATWKTRVGTPRQRRCAPSVSETGSMRPRGACCVVTAQSQWTSAPLWSRWSWMASSGTCWNAMAPSPGSLSSRAPWPRATGQG